MTTHDQKLTMRLTWLN